MIYVGIAYLFCFLCLIRAIETAVELPWHD